MPSATKPKASSPTVSRTAGLALVALPLAVLGSSAGLGVGLALGLAVGAMVGANGLTITENVPLPVWPTASMAVQVTVVVPTAKVEPEAGRQATLAAPPCSSVPAGVV